jgi:hypothetical protein
MDTGAERSSPEVKRSGRETDHSPPTSAEGKQYVDIYIHCSIRLQHRDNFTFENFSMFRRISMAYPRYRDSLLLEEAIYPRAPVLMGSSRWINLRAQVARILSEITKPVEK